MADNVELNSASGGAVIATDDIGGVHYQIVKAAFGALDGVTLVTSSTGLPVAGGAAHDAAVAGNPVLLAVEAKNFDGSALPNAVSAEGDTVRLSASLEGVLYVMLVNEDGSAVGTINVNSHAVTNAGTFVVQIDGDALTSLQLIDNLATLVLAEDAAHQSGDAGIQVLAVRDDTLNARSGAENDYEPLHTNADGALWAIDVNSAAVKTAVEAIQTAVEGTLTVSGTVDLGATDNAVLDAIAASVAAADTDLTTIIGHVDGIETLLGTIDADTGSILTAVELIDNIVRVEDEASAGGHAGAVVLARRTDTPANQSGTDGDYEFLQVSAGRLWASVVVDTALPAGTNNIGDVDVLTVVTGTGATNLGKAEDAGHSGGDTGVFVLGVRNDTPNTALTNTDADYGALSLYRTGAVRTAIPEEDFAALGSNHVKKYYTNAGAATDGVVWSPAAGKRWYVTDLIVNVSAACTVTFEDDKAGGDEEVMKFEFAANSGIAHHFATPWFSGEDAADLLVTTSAGNIYITAVGYEI